MSNFFNIKKLWSDTRKVLTITSCGLAIITNIAVFAYLSATTILPSFIYIIISNIISILITYIIYKPISKIIDEEVQSRLNTEYSAQKQLMDEKNELEQQYKHMVETAREREKEIKRLESELDTAMQYKSISSNANLVLKLEQMEYEKEGYLVKEEYVREHSLGQDIKKSSLMNPFGSDKGDQKVLYIKKYHEKALIGIDLEKIRFCRHNGQIYLEGIKVENLHPEMKPRDNGDDQYKSVKHCMILNTENSGKDVIGINTDSKYEDFKEWYTKEQDDIFLIDFKTEVTNLCASYTNVLRHNLHQKFPSLQFVDRDIEQVIELKGEPIMSLNLNKDFDILEVSSSIMMIANTMNQTMPIARR